MAVDNSAHVTVGAESFSLSPAFVFAGSPLFEKVRKIALIVFRFVQCFVKWCPSLSSFRFSASMLLINGARTLLVVLTAHKLKRGHVLMALALLACLSVALMFDPMSSRQTELCLQMESSAAMIERQCVIINELETRVKENLEELDGSIQKNFTLAAELKLRDEEFVNTNSKLETTRKELEGVKDQLSIFSGVSEAVLRSKIEALNAEVENLTSVRESLNNLVLVLGKEVDRLRNLIDLGSDPNHQESQLSAEIASLTKQLEEKQDETSKLSAEIAILTKQLEEKQDETSKLSTKIEDLEKQLEDRDSSLAL